MGGIKMTKCVSDFDCIKAAEHLQKGSAPIGMTATLECKGKSYTGIGKNNHMNAQDDNHVDSTARLGCLSTAALGIVTAIYVL